MGKTDINKAQLISEGRAILEKNPSNLFAHRIDMVILMLGGMSPDALAEYSGDSRSSLYAWRYKALTEGLNSLANAPSSNRGRKTKLSPEQMEDIFLILDGPSKWHGFNSWTGKTLKDLVQSKYGVDLSLRACQKILKEANKLLQEK